MDIYYGIVIFIFGLILGSFYTVVGERLPEGKSIVNPPSHCPNCNHRLGILELIPVFSFLFLGGKCKKCRSKIPVLSTIIEVLTAILFLIAYIRFGISIKFFIALIFISMLVIVIVSDIRYMVICDEVLIIGNILIFILLIISIGFKASMMALIYAVASLLIMLSIKTLGDIIFKKESMGGGDIKLMFTFGLVLGIPSSVASIFLASFIGLPISLIMMKKNSSHELPFGPYLSIAAIILLLSGIDVVNVLVSSY